MGPFAGVFHASVRERLIFFMDGPIWIRFLNPTIITTAMLSRIILTTLLSGMLFFLVASCKSTTTNSPAESNLKETTDQDATQPAEAVDETEMDAETTETQSPFAEELMTIPLDKSGQPRSLTMEETIKLVLQNNNTVRLQQLEIVKADTDLLKEEAKYTPKVDFKAQNYQKTDKTLPSTVFSGTKISQNTYTAGIEKLFESGTFFRLEGSDTRFDSNAGEGATALSNSLLSRLAQPPVHTGAVSIQLQQELLKNSFGYSQRRLSEIARKQSLLKREQLEYQLTGLVVQTMINYWNLAIAEQEVTTSRLLLNNTTNIRNITAQKLNIGLAEGFELNQWNALVSSAEIQVEAAELNRNTMRRDLLRTMNLDPNLKLTGATDLIDELPADIDIKKDTEYALQHRPDLKAIDKQMEIARLSTELADNNLLPTMRIGGKYSSRDWGRHGTTAFNAVPDGSYPETGVEFYMQYPLWDEGAKVDARNARITLKQLTIQKAEITRQVMDEVVQGHDQIRVSFQALQKARNALRQTEAFYLGLVNGYQRGRFTAVAVKNALDSLVQARQALTRASIQYNISLVRYDMIRNRIFPKYNIDIDDVIYKMENRLEK